MERNDFMAESPGRRNGRLRDLVQLVKRKDPNRYEVVPIPEPVYFEKGFFVMIRALQLLVEKNEGIIFVGVAGSSGAGKTLFTEKVHNFLPNIAGISMDNYNDASRIVDGNFDDPRLTDYDTLLENMHGLKEGRSVQVPIYDFRMSCRSGYRTVDVPSSRIVIIEGIYALSDKLRPILDLRVSVTGSVHFDLVKRVLRDMQRVGQEPEEIIHQIAETVYPMYKAFIEPDLKTAHIRIINKFNPFSGFQNLMYILKSPRSVTPYQIKAALGEDQTESNDESYDIYLLPPGEDAEASQSYLRMRNREGKYSLMFEEWVTDNPFIVSPRITFEVSVRLLGGLMALGYTIAATLKRSSRVFSDGKATVKIDWLEQLNRSFIQVQGKERLYVKFVAEQLGLDGCYIPRTYIEQIHLEKLIEEVRALRDDHSLVEQQPRRLSLSRSVSSGNLYDIGVENFTRHVRKPWAANDDGTFINRTPKRPTRWTWSPDLHVPSNILETVLQDDACPFTNITSRHSAPIDVMPCSPDDLHLLSDLETILQDESSRPHDIPLQYLKKITNNFSDDRILGEGGSGVVYKGVLPNGEMVAVKKIVSSLMPGPQKQFQNEVCHLMILKHPNIVRCVGYCYETRNACLEHNGKHVFAEVAERLLCLEYLPKGSLDKYISDESSGLDWSTRYNIIKGICYGLCHLHEQTNDSIIHLDLKPANILLDDGMVPKITDFGLSRQLDQKTIKTSSRDGTFGYMPPELFHGGTITRKSDIFSLGVIIVEVITGDKPDITGKPSDEIIELTLKKWRNVLHRSPAHGSVELDCEQIKRCIQVGLICVNHDRTKRPSITKVINMLQGSESID